MSDLQQIVLERVLCKILIQLTKTFPRCMGQGSVLLRSENGPRILPEFVAGFPEEAAELLPTET